MIFQKRELVAMGRHGYRDQEQGGDDDEDCL